jgi:hypothetical protein
MSSLSVVTLLLSSYAAHAFSPGPLVGLRTNSLATQRKWFMAAPEAGNEAPPKQSKAGRPSKAKQVKITPLRIWIWSLSPANPHSYRAVLRKPILVFSLKCCSHSGTVAWHLPCNFPSAVLTLTLCYLPVLTIFLFGSFKMCRFL